MDRCCPSSKNVSGYRERSVQRWWRYWKGGDYFKSQGANARKYHSVLDRYWMYHLQSRFNITLRPESLHFVFLKSRNLVEDSSWPRFTILGQSIGSMVLAWEGISKLIPDIYIGMAFIFLICQGFWWWDNCSSRYHGLRVLVSRRPLAEPGTGAYGCIRSLSNHQHRYARPCKIKKAVAH